MNSTASTLRITRGTGSFRSQLRAALRRPAAILTIGIAIGMAIETLIAYAALR